MILPAACQRPNRLALPLPGRLKGGAAQKVVGSLIDRGLIEEIAAKPGEPVCGAFEDGHGTTLVATDAALAALGIETDSAPTAPVQAAAGTGAGSGRRRKEKASGVPTAAPARKTRDGTKQAALIAMLERRTAPRWVNSWRRRAGSRTRCGDARRGAEEAAGSDDRVGEGRGPRARLPDRALIA